MALLSGITVLDLSSLLPAPFAAFLLAKMGARVVKIESPKRPDPARQFGYVPPGKTSSAYRAINDSKELVLIDLKTPSGQGELYKLVAKADAVIQGYRPDVRERLGIEYEALQRHNPRLVYCSVMGYAPHGPFRARAGHDINFVARSGILDQTRDERGRVVPLGAPLGDYSVAYGAAFRMVCALLGAQRTGKGSHVELSIDEILREIQLPFLAEAKESGEMPRAGDTLVTGKYPCYGLYELAGGTLAVGALEEKFWEEFCRQIGRRDLVKNQFATGEAASAVRSEVLKALGGKSFSEWVGIFEKADCCVDPVLPVKDVLHGV